MKNQYGITMKSRRVKHPPVPLNLSSNEILEAAKRVIATHSKVLKALAKR